jgi:hypothetical protein
MIHGVFNKSQMAMTEDMHGDVTFGMLSSLVAAFRLKNTNLYIFDCVNLIILSCVLVTKTRVWIGNRFIG